MTRRSKQKAIIKRGFILGKRRPSGEQQATSSEIHLMEFKIQTLHCYLQGFWLGFLE